MSLYFVLYVHGLEWGFGLNLVIGGDLLFALCSDHENLIAYVMYTFYYIVEKNCESEIDALNLFQCENLELAHPSLKHFYLFGEMEFLYYFCFYFYFYLDYDHLHQKNLNADKEMHYSLDWVFWNYHMSYFLSDISMVLRDGQMK